MPLILFIAFIVIPVVEIYVIVKVGGVLGVLPTVAILLTVSVVGAWLVRREGRRAWRTLNEAIGQGQLPGRELADAALVLVGGVLLLTPGFVTDALGLCMVLPPIRPLVRAALFAMARRRARVLATRSRDFSGGTEGTQQNPQSTVIRGEVIDDERSDQRDE